jgi:hypothetical protein
MSTRKNLTKTSDDDEVDSNDEIEVKATKKKASKRKPKSEDDEEDSDDEVEVKKGKKKTTGKLNYAAICILVMMVLPALITLGIQAVDMLYPKAAEKRSLREKVVRCYSAAKPNEKVDLDKIMKKYDGKEHVLFSNLGNKYGRKFPECRLG